MIKKSVAIMQPYLFPNMQYFNLIEAASKFIFLDDVAFRKKGFINRNTILNNNKTYLFTVPLKKASQNKMINEIEILLNDYWLNKFYKQLKNTYSRAPYFSRTIDILMETFNSKNILLSELAINSILNVCKYINLKCNYQISSQSYNETKGQNKSERLVNISKQSNSKFYINVKGGSNLYRKDFFHKRDITLIFLKKKMYEYPQFKNTFIDGLSIIDVLMFCEIKQINNFLFLYQLT